MILIIGLGNPGRRFRNTPHNLGAETIDRLRKRHRLPRFGRQNQALTTQGEIGKQKVVLAKPLTFMNESGRAVAALAKELQADPNQIWIIHDDADLPLGEFRISANRGSGGHKGVASVIEQLQSRNFHRLRLGAFTGEKRDLKNFVLEPYRRTERTQSREMIEQAMDALEENLTDKEG